MEAKLNFRKTVISIGMDFAALCAWRQFYLPGEDILTVDSNCGCADAYAGAIKDTNPGAGIGLLAVVFRSGTS
jgi:hypothetical protein